MIVTHSLVKSMINWVYLGLASMVFDEYIEDKCKEHGIAIIKHVGDTVIINDENLSTF